MKDGLAVVMEIMKEEQAVGYLKYEGFIHSKQLYS